MSVSLTIERQVQFTRRARGRRQLEEGVAPPKPPPEPGRVPRVSRLMALALRFEDYIRQGVVSDYAELAQLGQVSRARITQIMNLMNLAPDIQEGLLFLPRTQRGRDPIILQELQSIALVRNWGRQRRLWKELVGRTPQI